MILDIKGRSQKFTSHTLRKLLEVYQLPYQERGDVGYEREELSCRRGKDASTTLVGGPGVTALQQALRAAAETVEQLRRLWEKFT